jgi:hypothetical protein
MTRIPFITDADWAQPYYRHPPPLFGTHPDELCQLSYMNIGASRVTNTSTKEHIPDSRLAFLQDGTMVCKLCHRPFIRTRS